MQRNSNETRAHDDTTTATTTTFHRRVEVPVASFDPHTGKLVYARNNEIQTANCKGVVESPDGEALCADGERLPLVPKDLGACEIFPQSVKHNCNGRFVCVCGDGEYIIYTSQALRNKSFGSALDFAWSAVGTGDFAIRESISRIKVFKNFNEHKVVKAPVSAAEGLHGGHLLGVRGPDCIAFLDWEGTFIRKIDVVPTQIFWNETGELCLLACEVGSNNRSNGIEAAIRSHAIRTRSRFGFASVRVGLPLRTAPGCGIGIGIDRSIDRNRQVGASGSSPGLDPLDSLAACVSCLGDSRAVMKSSDEARVRRRREKTRPPPSPLHDDDDESPRSGLPRTMHARSWFG